MTPDSTLDFARLPAFASRSTTSESIPTRYVVDAIFDAALAAVLKIL